MSLNAPGHAYTGIMLVHYKHGMGLNAPGHAYTGIMLVLSLPSSLLPSFPPTLHPLSLPPSLPPSLSPSLPPSPSLPLSLSLSLQVCSAGSRLIVQENVAEQWGTPFVKMWVKGYQSNGLTDKFFKIFLAFTEQQKKSL